MLLYKQRSFIQKTCIVLVNQALIQTKQASLKGFYTSLALPVTTCYKFSTLSSSQQSMSDSEDPPPLRDKLKRSSSGTLLSSLVTIAVCFSVLSMTACQDDVQSTSSVKVIRITGIPDDNPTEIARHYQPVVNLLKKNLKTDVVYVPVTDYGAAVHALLSKKVDFAWLGGLSYVQARRQGDVIPLVSRDIDKKFRSVIVVNKNKHIKGIHDLKGKKFAFGAKSSTSGHLMPRYFLTTKFRRNIVKEFAGPPLFSGAHDATVALVQSGKVDAGALNFQTWKRLKKEQPTSVDQVEVLAKTPPYVNYVWTTRTDVPEDITKMFVKTFITLSPKNKEHKKILDLMGAQKYIYSGSKEFDQLERIGKIIKLIR